MNQLYGLAPLLVGLPCLVFSMFVKDAIVRGRLLLGCATIMAIWAVFNFLVTLLNPTPRPVTNAFLLLVWFSGIVLSASLLRHIRRDHHQLVRWREEQRLKQILSSHERID